MFFTLVSSMHTMNKQIYYHNIVRTEKRTKNKTAYGEKQAIINNELNIDQLWIYVR